MRNAISMLDVCCLSTKLPERQLLNSMCISVKQAYTSKKAAARHQETKHYAAWRDTVESLVEAPRELFTYTARSPMLVMEHRSQKQATIMSVGSIQLWTGSKCTLAHSSPFSHSDLFAVPIHLVISS